MATAVVSGFTGTLLTNGPWREIDEVVSIFDCDGLVVSHEVELALFSACQIVLKGNPGLLLDLPASDLVGVKFDLLLLRLADLDEYVDGMCFNTHRTPPV